MHGVRALIVLGALAHQEIAREQTLDHVGERRAVDAGQRDEIGLARAVVLFDGGQHRDLTRGQTAASHFARVKIGGELLTAVQQVTGRTRQIECALRHPRTPNPVRPRGRGPFLIVPWAAFKQSFAACETARCALREGDRSVMLASIP